LSAFLDCQEWLKDRQGAARKSIGHHVGRKYSILIFKVFRTFHGHTTIVGVGSKIQWFDRNEHHGLRQNEILGRQIQVCEQQDKEIENSCKFNLTCCL
jgi:hypothetical protein